MLARRPTGSVSSRIARSLRVRTAGAPALLGDVVAQPLAAAGITLPIWAQLLGLGVANILGIQVRVQEA